MQQWTNHKILHEILHLIQTETQLDLLHHLPRITILAEYFTLEQWLGSMLVNAWVCSKEGEGVYQCSCTFYLFFRILPSDTHISRSGRSEMHWLMSTSSCKYLSGLNSRSLRSFPCQSFNHHSETFHVITLNHSSITFQDMVKWQ